MLTAHEQAVADLLARAWIGPFHHSYEMPTRRGSSAKWVQWHSARNINNSSQEWSCSSLANAAEQYAWDEILLEQRKRDRTATVWTSDECRTALTSTDNSHAAFHAACIQTLRWGKVERNRGEKQNASVSWLNEALQRGSIVQDVHKAVALLKGKSNPAHQFGVTLPMNSAMTKIYAFADASSRLAIYDGRVGAALALFAMEYWHPREEELPTGIRFAYFDSQAPSKRGSRNPSVERYSFPVLGQHAVHARWMWSASRILNEAAKVANCTTLQLERALFMVGYDVSRSKVRYGQQAITIA